MRIGLDIDGVLTDVQYYQVKYGSIFFKKHFNKRIVDENGYSIKEIFHCSEQDEMCFWRYQFIKYAFFFPARSGASECIQELKRQGHQIHIISARVYADKKNFIGALMRISVRIWLHKNKIPYDTLSFCNYKQSGKEKSILCKNLKINYMVDDSLENLECLSKETCGIYYSTVREIRNKKIEKEVHNFDELFSMLIFGTNICTDRMEQLPFNEKKYRKEKRYFKRVASTVGTLLLKLKRSKIIRVENLKLPQSIFIANHQSHSDLPIMWGVLKNHPVSMLCKMEIKENKLYGNIFRKGGAVFVIRNNKYSRREARFELEKILLHGGNILIFPEGTFNKSEKEIIPFHYGAVYLAQRTGIPITPVTIEYCIDNKTVIYIGEPIYISKQDSLQEKNKRLEEIVIQMRKEHKNQCMFGMQD